MGTPEEARKIDFGFMTVSDYEAIVNGGYLHLIESDEDFPPDGTYLRMIDKDEITGAGEHRPRYIIQVPETDEGMSRIAFLRQLEWIRRELKYGVDATKGEGLERLFQEVDIELAATLFYRDNMAKVEELMGDPEI